MLVISNNARNRHGEVCALPVRRGGGWPSVEIAGCTVRVGDVIRLPSGDLEAPVFEASAVEMHIVGQQLADLLLLPEQCSRPPVLPSDGPPGAYPRWGRIYYADPPLGGQTKRWLVVSHDHFNAASGDAICVRTTSNTSLHADELPFIERGFALAVCPDLLTKRHERFETLSFQRLAQPLDDEMSKVAIGIVNFLSLYREAGFTV